MGFTSVGYAVIDMALGQLGAVSVPLQTSAPVSQLQPIVAETGWSLSTVFLGFTIALLVMGFISTWVGRLIDRIGARLVMTIGTIIVSAGLLALSQVQDPASYFAVWAVLGVGMRCCLYDAAFAALVQVTPSRGRKAISYLTLYGAYASTVFWVIGHYLNEAYG